MNAEDKKHEAKMEFDLGFDHIFELGDHPKTFKDFLETFGDSIGDATRWIEEKYGRKAADSWSRILDTIDGIQVTLK
jgi:hypothetical protein